MSLSDTVLKNVIVSFAGRIYNGLLSFVVVAVLLPRILDGEGFGVYAFYSTLFMILGVIVDFGSNAIAVREGAKDPGRLGPLLHSLTLIRLFMSVLCLAAAVAAAFLFEKDRTARLLAAAASLHLLFHSLGGFGVVFHVRMKFSFAVLAGAAGQTLFFAAALVLFLSRCSRPGDYLIALGAGLALSNTVSFFMGRRLVPGPIKGGRKDLARLLKEAFPLGISSVLSIAYFNVDTLLLRPLRGEEAVGLYNAAYRLLTFAILFPVLFNQVMLPVYSRFSAKDRDRFRRVVSRSVLYMAVVSVPLAAALVPLAEPVMRLVFPSPYVRASDCLRILGIAVMIIFVTYPHVSALIAAGRQKTYTWIALFGLLVNVALNMVWIPAFGIEGAAWATVATEGFVLVAAAVSMRRRAGFWAVSPALVKVLPATAAVGGAAWLFREAPVLVLLPGLALILWAVLYLSGLLPFNIGDENGN